MKDTVSSMDTVSDAAARAARRGAVSVNVLGILLPGLLLGLITARGGIGLA